MGTKSVRNCLRCWSFLLEMGGSTSQLIDQEKTSWVKEHTLNVEPSLGREYRNLVEQKFKKKLNICYKDCEIYGVKYQHWFVTDGTWIIEFGSGDISNNTVVVHSNPKRDYIIADEFMMT